MVEDCVVDEPLNEAVITSEPAQPLSLYDAVATPLTVVAVAVRNAVPLPAQVEEKETVCGVVIGVPPLDTVTVTLVVPKAESGAAAVLPEPNVSADMDKAVVPIEYPVEADTLVPLTTAVAVIVDAPEAEILAGDIETEATPEASVRAVPPVGEMVPIVELVVKATTALGTAAPLLSSSVARTIAGAALDIEVIEVPAESVKAREMEPPPAVVVPVVPVPVPVFVPTALPPQPESKVTESKRAKTELERHKEMVRTETLLIDELISPYCENV